MTKVIFLVSHPGMRARLAQLLHSLPGVASVAQAVNEKQLLD